MRENVSTYIDVWISTEIKTGFANISAGVVQLDYFKELFH